MEFFSERLLPILQEYGLLAIFITMALECAGIDASEWLCRMVASCGSGDVPVASGGGGYGCEPGGSLAAYAAGRYGGHAFSEPSSAVSAPFTSPPPQGRRVV